MHAFQRKLRIDENSGAIREPKEFGKVDDRTRSFLRADHSEVALIPVQVCEKNEARFVEVGRQAKKMTRHVSMSSSMSRAPHYPPSEVSNASPSQCRMTGC